MAKKKPDTKAAIEAVRDQGGNVSLTEPLLATGLPSLEPSTMKILQIIPATDWYAIFDNAGMELSNPLVCWALVQEEDGDTAIRGMVADSDGAIIEAADKMNNF